VHAPLNGVMNSEISIVQSAEKLAENQKFSESLTLLRTLSLEAWGELLWQTPSPIFPNLGRLLPKMSSREIQKSWTGSSDQQLLNETVAFVRYALSSLGLETAEMNSVKVLDYGCGYGRISRLMLKYFPFENLCGVDPWQQSLDLAWDAGFKTNYLLTDEVPDDLPFKENYFALIWAFSVFTHLSPEVGFRSIQTLAKYLKSDGSLVVTIRPIEYWDLRTDIPSDKLNYLKYSHTSSGRAFLPHDRAPSGKWGIVYGDTSISLKQLEKNIGPLKIKEVGGSVLDKYQTYVTLSF